MPRTGPFAFFRQSLKSDSFHADEIMNVFVLRPIAAVIVWILYPTRVTPNQITLAAVAAGLVAAALYAGNTPGSVFLAGLLVTAKDVLDDADGQLARSKQLYSRRGRFLDSIGDFVVDAALFAGITRAVWASAPGAATIVLGAAGLAGITLRVSYHVFYQVSFLHLEKRYGLNRVSEEVTEEDLKGDPVALRLQRVFNAIYGWQDVLMAKVDRWCMCRELPAEKMGAWYGDRRALRLSGLFGFGTEFALLTVCSLVYELRLYLILNVFVMNAVLIATIAYRRFVVSARIP